MNKLSKHNKSKSINADLKAAHINSSYDEFMNIGSAIIQHGKLNDRIYLIKLGSEAPDQLIKEMIKIAEKNNYSKIFAKTPETLYPVFEKYGFIKEAFIPNFFKGIQKAVFTSLFCNPKRKILTDKNKLDSIITTAKNKKDLLYKSKTIEFKNYFESQYKNFTENGFKIRICTPDDALEMSEIYKKVFKTYPFPIHEPEYLISTMKKNITYFCVEIKNTFETKNKIAALSSAEMDKNMGNAEMTDFATLPEFSGNGFALFLLYEMENFIRKNNFLTAYTIARAASFGMNITFAKMNYIYSGRLINNTNISGAIESMNIWYKNL
jgi:putative beta-lysine N-acetyltransferase